MAGKRAPYEPKPPYPARYCEECGLKFLPKTVNQKFHISTCQKKHNDRALLGGFKLFPLIMRWRIDRDKDALGDLTAAADQYAYVEREIRRKRKEMIASYRAAG